MSTNTPWRIEDLPKGEQNCITRGLQAVQSGEEGIELDDYIAQRKAERDAKKGRLEICNNTPEFEEDSEEDVATVARACVEGIAAYERE
jgi:hypothetical protein